MLDMVLILDFKNLMSCKCIFLVSTDSQQGGLVTYPATGLEASPASHECCLFEMFKTTQSVERCRQLYSGRAKKGNECEGQGGLREIRAHVQNKGWCGSQGLGEGE